METISLAEAFERIETEKQVVLLYTLKEMSINSTLDQICALIDEHNKVVSIIKVLVDPEKLSREDATKLGIIRLPQLRFYGNGILLGTMTGQASPSDVYERILSLYT